MTANRDALNGLRTTVHGIESAVDSAVTLISGLVNRLAAALMGNDLESDITSLRDELEAAKEQLAASVAANTLAADDSDNIDSEGSPTNGVAVGEPSGDDSADEASPSDETEAVGDGEEVSGDTSTLPTGDDVVAANSGDSDTTQAGTGVIGDGVAVDTSATTDETEFGNGDGSEEDASGAGVNNADGTDSSDENGHPSA